MNDKKMNFFKQLGIAIARPDLYGRLAQVGTGRMIAFVFLFSLIYMFVWLGLIFGISLAPNGKASQTVKEFLPDFYLEDGKLFLEESYSSDVNGSFVFIDTDVEQFQLSDLEYVANTKQFSQILLISETNLIVSNNRGEISEIKFSDLKLPGKIAKDELVDMGVNEIKKVSWIGAIVLFPFVVIAYFVMAFLFMIIAVIITAIFAKSIKGGQLYRLGIYSCAMLMVLGLIFEVLLVGIVPGYFCSLIYFVALLVYLFMGIFSIEHYNAKNRRQFTQEMNQPYSGAGYSYISPDYGTTSAIGNLSDDAFSNEPVNVGESTRGGNMNSTRGNYGANTSNTYGANSSNSYGINSNTTYGTNGGNSYGADNSTTYGVNSSNTYEVNSGSGNAANNGSQQDFYNIYGMNVIGMDGKLQGTTEQKTAISTNEVQNKEEKEEGVISHHKGLETNVISNDGLNPVQAYPPVIEKVQINGVSCKKSDLDLVDKYLVVGLRESAVDTLCELIKCTKEEADNILINWNQYYNG